MKIEIWKDDKGYKIELEDNSFELTPGGFESLIGAFDRAYGMEASYIQLHVDLEEEEDK